MAQPVLFGFYLDWSKGSLETKVDGGWADMQEEAEESGSPINNRFELYFPN